MRIFVSCICRACTVILRVFVYLIFICFTSCVFVVQCVYCCSYLSAGLLARNQYPKGPAAGHLDTGVSSFSCIYKRMRRWFPSLKVATTCLSYSPPDVKFRVTLFHTYVHVM